MPAFIKSIITANQTIGATTLLVAALFFSTMALAADTEPGNPAMHPYAPAEGLPANPSSPPDQAEFDAMREDSEPQPTSTGRSIPMSLRVPGYAMRPSASTVSFASANGCTYATTNPSVNWSTPLY